MYPPNPYDVLSLTGVVEHEIYCEICGCKIDPDEDYDDYHGGAICRECSNDIKKGGC